MLLKSVLRMSKKVFGLSITKLNMPSSEENCFRPGQIWLTSLSKTLTENRMKSCIRLSGGGAQARD